MILQSLVNLYEVLAKNDKVEKLGWCKSNVSYILDIDVNGNLINVLSVKMLDRSGKKEVASPFRVPMQQKKSSNVAPNFLCDSSSYFLGSDRKGNPERSKQCFEASKQLHNELLSQCNSTEAKAIIKFFENWNIDNTEQTLKNIGCSDNTITDILKNGANLLFAPLGKYAADYPDLCNCWDNFYNNSNSENGLCLVTGKHLPIATLHPLIKGVRGAQSMGTSLVSFNAKAFESFGKCQGLNSPTSEYAAFAYSTALNYLLSENDYVTSFGDTTVVCWAENANEEYQDIMTKCYGSDNTINQDDLWSVVNKLSKGESVNWNNIPLNPDNKFYILGLSPNVARLSVRFFLQNTFGAFMKNIKKHQDEMKIVTHERNKNIHFPVWKILKETVNQNSKNKTAKPQLAGDLVYSILSGYKYPETLYNNIMIRIKAERIVSPERDTIRSSVIKAFLTRNYPEFKEALTMELNENCTNQAYVLGQLFSLLEEIQKKANKGINTTIKDKYFSSASSTPALVFPLLIDLSQKHIRKINDKKYKIYYDKKLTELFAKMNTDYPVRMSMQEKGIFQIGYYHQTQKHFTKQEDK